MPLRAHTELIQDPNAQLVIDLANGRITGPLTITAGSVGYNNLTDKPDLTGYLTKSEFKVTADQIRAEVGRANQTAGGTKAQLDAFQQQTQQNVNNLLSRQATADDKIYRLQTAGFISRAEGNALYASAQLANGKTIASYITQSPEAINMISRNININAAVTFESYKEDNAQKLAAVNRRVSNTETTLSNQQNQLNQKQGKYDPFDINNARLNGKTVIEGGLIKTELINTNALVVKKAASIGGFHVDNDGLTSASSNGHDFAFTAIQPNGWIQLFRGNGSNGGIMNLYGEKLEILGNTASFTVSVNTPVPGSGEWNNRTLVKMTNLPHVNTLRLAGGKTFRTLKICEENKYLCWE
ncbi:hypothetical protein T229_02800 [Tannerella sp. oral taxon BU063 isolate Cell 5]|uniref:DUF1983 domain-containing protein n=1 Tax=Tannerella sp. oral taxon BU063 isolate Cell 5 TaxID=1410950 RepID=W2CE64_9BACT|nr:hypothetical protein T229_02800 [Tannerella sp. oral taxon BU063 isolate Cell 5]